MSLFALYAMAVTSVVLFVRVFIFLLQTMAYKRAITRQRNGRPKAYYPTINKPNFFHLKSYNNGKN